MKELVYPAVIYKDDEKGTNTGWYTIGIEELGLYVDAETIVEAYIKAKEYLCATVDCAIKFDCDIEAPRSFEEVYNENNKGKKKNIVLLVDALA